MTVEAGAVASKKKRRDDLTEDEKFLIPEIDPHYLMPKDIKSDVYADIGENRKILLTGHMGCGKTSFIEQIAAKMGQPVIRVNMNGQTTIQDFVGLYGIKGGETHWIDGALPLAMRRGYWLIVDEIDFAEPAILSVLNPVTEPKGKLFLKEKGHEIVRPHEYFRLFATANTVGCMEPYRFLYQGANLMNKALLDRFRIYKVGYLPQADEVKVLMDKIEDLPEKVATWFVQMADEIRSSFEGELLSSTFSLRALIDFAQLMTRKKRMYKEKQSEFDSDQAENVVKECIKIAILSKVSKEDGELINQIADRVFL